MPNIHRRVLVALPFVALAVCIPSSALATTTFIENQNDVVHSPPGGAVETVYGYDFVAYVTTPSSVAASTPYTVSITDALNMPYYNWWCQNTNTGSVGGPDGTGCDSGNVGLRTVTFNGASQGYYGYGNNNITLNVTAGASGSDSIVGSLGPAAGWNYGSNVFGTPQYNYFTTITWGVSVPIVQPVTPTVNINFSLSP